MNQHHPSDESVPSFRSIQEAAEFWDAHDTTAFEGFWQATDVEITRPVRRLSFVTLDLSDDEISRLRMVAAGLGVSPEELAKRWITEQLENAHRESAAD